MIKGRIKNKGDISTREIEEAYRKAFGMSKPNAIKRLLLRLLRVGNPICLPFLFADSYYKEASFATIEVILKETKLKFGNWVYINEEADCDDATFWLMGVFHQDRRTVGMPIFITWIDTLEDGHSLLSFYFKGTVYIVEPQSYESFFVPKDWRLLVLMG